MKVLLNVAAALLSFAFVSPAAAQGRLPQACDRACLSAVMDQYLAALTANDPGKAPLAQSVKYTENAADLDVHLKDGLWGTATRLGDKSYRAIDPVSGQVVYQGVAFEHDVPRTFTVRLKVWDRQITEIEQIVTRDAPQKMLDGAAAWSSDPILSRPAQGKPQSRDDMRRRAESYYDAILLADDSIAHFANCTRFENGQYMAKVGGCGGDFKDHRQAYNTSIKPRRIDVIDEAQNVVFGFVFMNRKGDVTTYTDLKGQVLPFPASSIVPGTTYAGVMMKIEDDQIAKVQGVWENIPYGLTSSWDRDAGRGR